MREWKLVGAKIVFRDERPPIVCASDDVATFVRVHRDFCDLVLTFRLPGVLMMELDVEWPALYSQNGSVDKKDPVPLAELRYGSHQGHRVCFNLAGYDNRGVSVLAPWADEIERLYVLHLFD
jgi:hypothetical protein